jgi:hypothetical protein
MFTPALAQTGTLHLPPPREEVNKDQIVVAVWDPINQQGGDRVGRGRGCVEEGTGEHDAVKV